MKKIFKIHTMRNSIVQINANNVAALNNLQPANRCKQTIYNGANNEINHVSISLTIKCG